MSVRRSGKRGKRPDRRPTRGLNRPARRKGAMARERVVAARITRATVPACECGKRPYPTKDAAVTAVRTGYGRGVYPCRDRRGVWHVTSRETR